MTQATSTIRFATEQDIPALAELGRHMHAITRFRTMPYDAQRVQQSLHTAFTQGQGKYVCMVADSSSQPVVGVLLAVLEQHIFSPQPVASIMHYDVLPQYRMGGYGLRLLKAFEQWCKNRQVAEINFGINSGMDHEKVGRFAQRMGYQMIGANYAKSL